MNPSRQAQRAQSSDLQEILQTMDVVDELRHRDAELAQWAHGDESQLKSKLAEIYRSHGVEVSEAVIAAGIKARRDQRFVHHAPSGLSVELAKLWINRATVGRRLGRDALLIVACMLLWEFGVNGPAQRKIQNQIATLNEDIANLPSQVESLKADLESAKSDLVASSEAASTAMPAHRLEPPVAAAKARAARSIAVADGALGQAGNASLEAITEQTVGQRSRRLEHLQQQWAAIESARSAIQSIQHDAIHLRTLVALSSALEQANASALQLPRNDRIDAKRTDLYASGAAALSASDASSAKVSIDRLHDLALVSRELDNLRAQAKTLLDAGQATQPSPKAQEELTAASAALDQALKTADPSQGREGLAPAHQAAAALSQIVETLGLNYTLTVVNRPNVRSGVWRYSTNNRNARNYYLVVEALDPQGKPVAIPVRNEESGAVEKVELMALRVPESQYEKVKADKLDNGLVDDSEVGRKSRGNLSVDYAVPVSGGFITHW